MTHTSLSRDGRRAPRALCGALLIGLAVSCSDDDPESELRTPTVAVFAPSESAVPLPNDLLFSGTLDGTLNVPAADPTNGADPAVAVGTVDGWSTVAPIIVEFSRDVDPTTVIGGSTVRLFEVTTFADQALPVGGPVLSADTELGAGVDYSVEIATEYTEGSAIRIQPLAPLTPSGSTPAENSVYMVVVTNGVLDEDGLPIQRDTEYIFAAVPQLGQSPPPPPELAQLNGLINSQLDAYQALTGDPREDVVVSFTFTTQSVGAALDTIFGVANGAEQTIIDSLCTALGTCGTDTMPDPLSDSQSRLINIAPEIGTASELLGGPVGVARIFNGILVAPYYLTEAENTSFSGLTNDSAPLEETWSSRYAPAIGVDSRNVTRFNPLPKATSSQQMPLLISVPDSGSIPMPPDGYPIVIFQHGIGGNRAAMLFIAERLAQVGLAVVAIDLPLHGIAEGQMFANMVSIFSGYDQDGDLWERTFGLDLLTESPTAPPVPGPDGNPDSSGAHFINLQDLAVSRDNLRQAAADLMNLEATLPDLMIMGADLLDETQVHFIGHSLGGIAGAPFVGIQPDLTAATLAMPGGAIPYLLNGSPVIAPAIQAGLGAVGVMPGTPDYSRFLVAAQTVVDTVDPVNYGARAQAIGTPTYLIEVIGGGMNGSPPDLLIPNSVPGMPLAGTEPLIDVFGLTPVSTSTSDPGGLRVAVRFVEGNHSSILLPTAPGGMATAEETAAWDEMQNQVAVFHDLDGTTLTVTNGTVVQ